MDPETATEKCGDGKTCQSALLFSDVLALVQRISSIGCGLLPAVEADEDVADCVERELGAAVAPATGTVTAIAATAAAARSVVLRARYENRGIRYGDLPWMV
jgi:hypothetical protein